MEDFDLDLSWLDENQDKLNEWLSWRNNSALDAQRAEAWSNGLSKGLNVMNAAAGIYGIASNAARVNNNPIFDANYANMQSYGTRDYNTSRELARDMSMMQNTYMPQSYEKVRGMTTGQKWGAVGTSTLTGAAAGAQFGPWGAAIGGAIGALGGAAGVALGNQKAKINTAYDNMRMGIAYNNGIKTANAAGERFADVNNRQKEMHVVRNGGRIQRSEDIMSFADRVLGRSDTIMPQRRMCKGGVRVTIRKK